MWCSHCQQDLFYAPGGAGGCSRCRPASNAGAEPARLAPRSRRFDLAEPLRASHAASRLGPLRLPDDWELERDLNDAERLVRLVALRTDAAATFASMRLHPAHEWFGAGRLTTFDRSPGDETTGVLDRAWPDREPHAPAAAGSSAPSHSPVAATESRPISVPDAPPEPAPVAVRRRRGTRVRRRASQGVRERRVPTAPAAAKAVHGSLWISGALFAGLTSSACGGGLLAWSSLAGRPELAGSGTPLLVLGQVVLMIGLLAQMEFSKGEDSRSRNSPIDQDPDHDDGEDADVQGA